MLNSSDIQEDNEEVVDDDFQPPLLTLCVNMIERGIANSTDPIQYFVLHFGSCNPKTKQILLDNMIALIATLSFDDVSSTCDRQRELTVYSLVQTSVDNVIANYRLKEYAQDKVSDESILILY
jgi:hypothetical protein